MPKLIGKHAKQELFCKEYIIDFNGAQACTRAGYSKKTAKEQSHFLLTAVHVNDRIAELMQKRNKRVEIDADYVLKRLTEIDELDVMDILHDDMKSFKPLSEWPKAWRISISGIDLMTLSNAKDKDIKTIIKKIKWPDKTKNLELIGKHVNVAAFSETFNLNSHADLVPWGDIKARVDKLVKQPFPDTDEK